MNKPAGYFALTIFSVLFELNREGWALNRFVLDFFH